MENVAGKQGQACVSQKSRKLFGPKKWPVKQPKTFIHVSQNPRTFRARKIHIIFPDNLRELKSSRKDF